MVVRLGDVRIVIGQLNSELANECPVAICKHEPVVKILVVLPCAVQTVGSGDDPGGRGDKVVMEHIDRLNG
ncbi:hypothetical protein AGR2A_pb10129 [Agrobacterium genomosp. 2 str. CFBP 5494]|uniref:Uncharacterized protein n=1 Tax=Agrobacterium genomosp. 2 str. CFBP 5494 TaxID=1183436 RepID=A0A9W5B7T7_9HYPH|nr:hypothetical protein AGR2A_pb10129 [Agrobacterium genomosp. 2 str. CFBP 5494]